MSAKHKPNRFLSQEGAVRRLIHSAVRMFALGEDPFAVHLLIQSADKMLIDIAKKRGLNLALNFEEKIKPEHIKEFFDLYRGTYNFLKHADRGPAQISVQNIAETNASQLAFAIENYASVFGKITEHMSAFRWFVRLWKPTWFSTPIDQLFPAEKSKVISEAWAKMRAGQPQQFFDAVFAKGIWNGAAALEKERLSDFADNIEFYVTPFDKMG